MTIFTHQIYTLKDPFNFDIFYVGITYETIERRLKAHINKSKELKHKVHYRINNIIANGGLPIIEILEILAPEQYNNERTRIEKYWIWQFKVWGFNLVNERFY